MITLGITINNVVNQTTGNSTSGIPNSGTVTVGGSVTFNVYNDFTEQETSNERVTDPSVHNLIPGGWSIAVCFPYGYDYTIFSISSAYVNKTKGNDRKFWQFIYIATWINLGGVNCNKDLFPIDDWNRASSMYLQYWYCIQDTQLSLQGNILSDAFQHIEVYFEKWYGNNDCQSSENIQQFVDGSSVEVYTLNTYYDGSDTSDSLKQYIEGPYRMELNMNSVTRLDLNVESNTISYMDGSYKIIYRTSDFQKSQW